MIPGILPTSPAEQVHEVPPLVHIQRRKYHSGLFDRPDRFSSSVKYVVNLYEISGGPGVDLLNTETLAHKKNQGYNVFLHGFFAYGWNDVVSCIKWHFEVRDSLLNRPSVERLISQLCS